MNKENIIGWVAGLFEGEGTFGFLHSLPKSIQITSTDLDVLEKVKDNFGGNIYKENRKSKKSHWKDAYVWQLSTLKAIEFFELIKPYLGKRRLSRGEEFVESWKEMQKKREIRWKEVVETRRKILELSKEGLTHKKIAEIVGFERSYITKIINDKYNNEIINMVDVV